MFPQLSVHPSTEYTRTDILNSDPILFLTEHARSHNHKPNFTPPSAVIAVVDNHSLPPFACLALLPPPPPSENQWDRYLSFLEDSVLSSEREHNVNAYVNLWFSLGAHAIRTGSQTVEGGGGAGYWVLLLLGISSTVPKLSPLRRNPKRRRTRRKIGRGTRSIKKRTRACRMSYLILRG